MLATRKELQDYDRRQRIITSCTNTPVTTPAPLQNAANPLANINTTMLPTKPRER